MSWYSAFKDSLNFLHHRKVKDMKDRLRRHVNEAQKRAHGAAWHTIDTLEEYGVIQGKERDIAQEAIEQLCDKRELECSDGRYYVKGNAPNFKN
jgi:hypothetical protein